MEGLPTSLEDLNLKQQQTASHKIPYSSSYLPFLILTSIIILSTFQMFHFNASFTNLSLNEHLNQSSLLNRNISFLQNLTCLPSSFTQNLSLQPQIADTDGIFLECPKQQLILKNPPNPNIEHPPIQILSDADFTSQGWPGLGTAANPYRIANLDINTSSITSDCIEIRNTQSHFVIANCTFFNAPNNTGINLFNVVNGTLTNNSYVNVHTGILLKECSAITIQEESFFNIVYGIQLSEGSHNNTLRLNTFYGSADPYSVEYGKASISLTLSSHNIIADNICQVTELPFNLSVSHHNMLRNNTSDEASRKGNEAINLRHSHNNSMIDNNLLRTIRIENSQSNTIQGNQLTNIGNLYARLHCIILDGTSADNRIVNNTGYSRVGFINILFEAILFENNSLIFCGIEFLVCVPYNFCQVFNRQASRFD